MRHSTAYCIEAFEVRFFLLLAIAVIAAVDRVVKQLAGRCDR